MLCENLVSRVLIYTCLDLLVVDGVNSTAGAGVTASGAARSSRGFRRGIAHGVA